MNREERQVNTGEVEKINNFEDLSKLNDDLSDKTKFAEMVSQLSFLKKYIYLLNFIGYICK